jgi:hypothetical protein
MVLDCRNPNHGNFIRSIFPDVAGAHGGIDLDNIEIKESRHAEMFTVAARSLNAEYFLFYHHLTNTFFITQGEEIRKNWHGKRQRGFRIKQIESMSLFQTNNIKEIQNKIKELRKPLDSEQQVLLKYL